MLRVRAALTELVPVDPAKNVAAKAVGTVIGVGLFLPTVDIGQAAIEVDMRDSNTERARGRIRRPQSRPRLLQRTGLRIAAGAMWRTPSAPGPASSACGWIRFIRKRIGAK